MMLSLLKKLNIPVFSTTKNSFLLLLLVGLLNFATSNAQISSYNVVAIANAYTNLPSPAGGANKVALSNTTTAADNGVFAVALPFAFTFNGITYASGTNINVSMNGFVTFGATAPSLTNETPISSTEGYAGAISIYGRDLETISPSTAINLSYFLLNTGANVAPNRILKIEWLIRRGNAANTGLDATNMPMQIWLYEGTNVIEMYYQQFNPSANGTGQIGLRGSVNTDFKNFAYVPVTAADWPATLLPLGVANTDVVRVKTAPGAIAAGSARAIRWTPDPCPSPSAVTVSNITQNSAQVNFTPPSTPPSNGYQFEIRTSGAAGSGATGLATSGATPGNPFTFGPTGTVPFTLAGNTSYTVYVRSYCGGVTYGSWVAATAFTTLCTGVFPYYEGFDPFSGSYTVPALPVCTSRQNAGTGNNWVTTNPVGAGYFDEHLIYNFHPTNPANAWFYTAGVNLIGGNEYRISYVYGGSSQFTFITNKMEVKYGLAPTVASMINPIDNHPVIKTSPFSNVVNFTAPSTGTYYFGFHGYSDANNGEIYLDDIEVVNSTCKKPTALTAPAALISFNSALVSWTAPSPAPGSGYTYYISTTNPIKTAGAFIIGNSYTITTIGTTDYTLLGASSNTIGVTFIATAAGTGTGTATELLSNNTAGTGTVAAGSTVVNLNGLTPSTTYYVWVRGNCSVGDYSQWSSYVSFTTSVAPPVYCLPSGATFPQDPNGITNVTMGTINNTTGIEANNYGDYSNLSTNVAQGVTIPVSITYRTGFTYDTNIWVDWDNNGTFSAAELMYQGNSSNAVPTTLSASFTVPLTAALGPKRLRIGGIDFGPYTDPCRNGNYQSFEDYTVNVVVAPPALTISSNTSTQCAGTPSPLVTITAGLPPIYDTFSWFPSSGVTGTPTGGYTFTNTSTTTYTLTANQTSGAYSTNSVSFVYVANDVPTPITIATPSGTVACPNAPGGIPLIASGGVVSNITIFNEDFNSGIGAWTTTNTSTGGANQAAPAWTVRPSGSVVSFAALTSNDNSQFVVSNSDAQGGTPSPSVTRTTLVSPAINLTGYQSASLSFYQYLNWIAASDIANVEVSNSNVGPWTVLTSYTSDQGAASAFALGIVNLNAYVGQTIYIRFNYQSNWGWWWALDNVKVAGSASSSIVWTPTTGLFNDAAGSSPYIAGTGANTVYVINSTPTTYTASASTPGPTICSATKSVSITVNPIVAGTVSSAQTLCYGSPANLTVSGITGTVLKWQYATTLAFTAPVDIASSASTTLTSAQMGTLTADRYYRAVVTNGSCTAYSNIIKITYNFSLWDGASWSNGTPSATVAAVFDADYDSANAVSPGNLTACSVFISSGDVTFLSGDSLISQNDVNTTGGTLTFENNASLVQVNNNAVNTGNITYKRNTTPIRKFDYTYWSSPVAPQTLVALSPLTLSDKYFSFNPSINNWVTLPGNSLMNPGKGYIIRAPNNFDPVTPAVFNAQFYGIPNNGVISTPIVIGLADVNLIGNPYPSALNINLFFDFNGITTGTGIVDKTIYLWTHNTAITANNYTNSDYAVYNYMGGIGTTSAPGTNNAIPNGKIASGQSFFIKGLANGNAVFNNSMRVAGTNNQFFKTAASSAITSNKDRLWLELFNGLGAYKQTLVGYAPGATNDFDSGYDGEYVDGGTGLSFYSMLAPKKLAIQGRGLPFVETDVIPLGYKNTVAGTYEIKLSNFDGIFDSQKVYLEDKLLNVIHNLKVSNYSFATNAGTFENRFQLRFTDSALSTNNQLFTEESVVVYKENQNIHFNASNTLLQEVAIYDIRGVLLFSKTNIDANELLVSNLTSSQQVLLVNIKSVEGKIVTKKIIF
ncbi:GEVED domain-containing protein [Flavobacterium sp. SUN052]|uniref:GEVED domain-containing protein n=1 Tax=Flavobacterium sp. SUN052 TaxID=3002441 RepID=UPI00237D8842|nr:GEVED domain-containing protein [Flavobacterium sp. SUN052]MEC4005921.1 GEVED domain-containing protein [Flavobacterium sp. SUN052]